MSKNRLSPLTSIAMSLSVALGILVADLSSTQSFAAAQGQGSLVPLAHGRVVGQRIVAANVLVNGVVTNGVFLGSVAVVDSVVAGSDLSNILGAFPHGPTPSGGAFPHEPEPGTLAGGAFPHEPEHSGGAFPHEPEPLTSGGAFPHEPEPSSRAGGVVLVGGVVTGEDVTVEGGVIKGRNLVVEGTVVSRSFSSGVETLD